MIYWANLAFTSLTSYYYITQFLKKNRLKADFRYGKPLLLYKIFYTKVSNYELNYFACLMRFYLRVFNIRCQVLSSCCCCCPPAWLGTVSCHRPLLCSGYFWGFCFSLDTGFCCCCWCCSFLLLLLLVSQFRKYCWHFVLIA